MEAQLWKTGCFLYRAPGSLDRREGMLTRAREHPFAIGVPVFEYLFCLCAEWNFSGLAALGSTPPDN